jgi:hypothetical protein
MRSELDWNEHRTQFRAVIRDNGDVIDVTPWMVPARQRWNNPPWVPECQRWSNPLRVLSLWDTLGLWSVMALVVWLVVAML